MKCDKALGLSAVLWTETSPAKHQDHRMRALQLRELAALRGVVGKLIVRKKRARDDTRSHRMEPRPNNIWRVLHSSLFWLDSLSLHDGVAAN